jgi:prophage maintenance system killer protein
MPTVYPSVEEIIELNKRAIDTIKVKKAGRHKILSRGRIELVLKNTQSCDGDLYDKAVTLLKGLTEMPHSFDSANRRTAFLAAVSFLEINGKPRM